MIRRTLFIFFWIAMMARPVYSMEIPVACAANFTGPMKELAKLYEKESGNRLVCTYGSTGMFYGQIKNGAPYSIFFAADEKRPYLLYEAGLAEKPFAYAEGKVVLWTIEKDLFEKMSWKDALTAAVVKHIGMANPETAPYGEKAMEALVSSGLYQMVQDRIAYGKSVGIAFQYGFSGATDVSFIALSQALSDKGMSGKYWEIAEAGKVKQAACVLKSGHSKEAQAFVKWMESPPVRKIIGGYGYE